MRHYLIISLIFRQKNAIAERATRISRLGQNELYILEAASLYLDLDIDFLIQCAADSEQNILLLESMCEIDGRTALVIQHKMAKYPGPGKKSFVV